MRSPFHPLAILSLAAFTTALLASRVFTCGKD